MKVQKKGRDLGITVDDLLTSKRWLIAVKYLDVAPELMRGVLMTLGEAAEQVAKSVVIKNYQMFGKKIEAIERESGDSEGFILLKSDEGLPAYQLLPILRSVNDFCRYFTWWKPSTPLELYIYTKDPLLKLDKDDMIKLVDDFKKLNS